MSESSCKRWSFSAAPIFNGRFDLVWVVMHAIDDDTFLGSTGKIEIAIRVEIRPVPHDKPTTVRESFSICLLVIVILFKYDITFYLQVAAFLSFGFLPFFSPDTHSYSLHALA